MSLNRFACCIVLVFASVTFSQTSQPTELQRGEFHTTFTERSPLSSPKEIARRLASKAPAEGDYDLAAQKFSIYVPKDYDPATPCGLLVFLCYKHSEETAPTLHDIFDREHLIFAVTQELPPTLFARIGTSLDVVQNLSKIYKIDPNRVWVLGEPPAQELALAFSDVFTAGIYRQCEYFRPIQSLQPNMGQYKPTMAHPLNEYLSRAKTHRHIHLMFPDPDEYKQLVLKAFTQDGFKQTLALDVGMEPYHYPGFTTDWFEKMITFLDAPPSPAMASGHQPATRTAAATPTDDASAPPKHPAAAAVSDPQRMLNLAKSYIAAKSYGPARTRLNTIIEKYPDDAAATEAKQLLAALPPP